MSDEPDIVKILKEEEKHGKLSFYSSIAKQELEIREPVEENIQTESSFNTKNENGEANYFDTIVAEKDFKVFSDLMEIINFTEKVSACLHGDFTEKEIIRIVLNEFKNSNRYTGSILLLSDDGKKLQIAGTSNNTGKFREAEKITGYKIKSYKISLEKSHIYSRVVHEGKTVHFKIMDLLGEIFPKKLASVVSRVISLDKNMHVATPLELDGKIFGAFAMSSTILADFFIPSVKNLALHISYAFEHAKHNLEQKNAEVKLAESEQLYRSMIERTPLGIFTVDTKGIVTSCNETFVKIAGYSQNELVGKNIAQFPTLRKRELPKYLNVFKSIIKGNIPEPFEFHWVHKDGTLCVGELHISLIKTNDKITGIQAIIRDLSESKETKSKLKDAEERYDSLFNSSFESVYLCDFKGRFIDANMAALRLLGYKREELRSIAFSSLLDRGQILKAFNVVREIKKFGYQKNIQEFKLRCKNGEFIYVESMGSLIYHDGKPFAVQGIARDITERKMNEIKIKNRTEDLELLNLVNNAIHTNQSLDEIIALISKETGEIFNSLNATVYLISEDKKNLEMKQPGLAKKDKKTIQRLAGINLSDFKIPLKKGTIFYEIIGENKPRLLNSKKEILRMIRDATDNKILKKLAPTIVKALKLNSTMLIPLNSDKECIGLIDISRETPFAESDMQRFENIAKQLNVAIEKIILKETKKITEEKYRDLYERLRDGSAVVNMDGKIIEFNSTFLDMLGYTEDEIHELTNEDITPKKWRHIEVKIIQEQILKQGFSNLYEKEYIRKDGTIIPVELTNYLLKDGDGIPTGMWAIVRDISERKEAENDIKESREHFRTLFNKIIDPVVIIDSKGNILEVTNEVREMTGFDRGELIGKNFLSTKFASRKTKAVLIKNLIKRMAGKKIPPYEIEVRTKKGRKVPCEINAARIIYNGKPADMVVFRDISVRKESERELKEAHDHLKDLNRNLEDKVEERTAEVKKLLEQKDEFINQLGHDLKNPLNPLVNLLPLVEKREQDSKSKEMLQIINRNVDFMKNLVVKTIKLAQLNSPNVSFYFEDINLLERINDVIEKNELMIDEKHMNVERNISGNIIVKADKLRLDELFDNLINNAIKYSPNSGNVTIDAKEDKNFVTVSVKDTGLGINKNQIELIFNEFYKADKVRHDFESSGLGLPICKRIVEKHGGRIWAESSGINKGSTFYFTVPKGCRIISEDTSEKIDKVLSNIEEKKGET